MKEQRFLRQRLPWIDLDLSDLVPQWDPETVVFIAGSGSLLGLHIMGLEDGPAMLGIREDELGRPESCAITNELKIDTAEWRDSA